MGNLAVIFLVSVALHEIQFVFNLFIKESMKICLGLGVWKLYEHSLHSVLVENFINLETRTGRDEAKR